MKMSYKNGYGHNEMIEAGHLLYRLENGNIVIKDSSIYPYIYTKADTTLIADGNKFNQFNNNQKDIQLQVLRMYLTEAVHSDNYNKQQQSFRLARGMMRRLGISYSRLSQIWDDAPEHLLESLNAHQIFFKKVEDAYNELLSEGHIPLIKNHGGSMVKDGSDISKKMRAHTHRIAKSVLWSLDNEDDEL
jgi:hypothetical protein